MIDRLRALYARHGDKLRYLLIGGMTTLVGVGSFALFNRALGVHHLMANALSWVLAVAFAFCGNKWFVFRSRASGGVLLREAAGFALARLATLGFETVFLYLLIDLLGVDEMLTKILCSGIVIILNYVLSGLLVFRRKPR